MKLFRTLAATVLAATSIALTAVAAHAEIQPAPKPNPPAKATGVVGDATGDGFADIWATIDANKYQGPVGRLDNSKTVFMHSNVTKGTVNYLTIDGAVSTELGTADSMTPVPDMNGDGRADFLVRFGAHLFLYLNLGDGYLKKSTEIGHGWGSFNALAFAGHLNGDSQNFLLGRTNDGNLYAYRIQASGGVQGIGQVGRGWGSMRFILGVGQMVGDAKADLVAIDQAWNMWCYAGTGIGTVSGVGQCGRGWNGFDAAFVPGDVDGDGRMDLIGVKSVTHPNAFGEPTGTLSSLPAVDRSPMYFYKNLGNAKWGSARLIGHDMFLFRFYG